MRIIVRFHKPKKKNTIILLAAQPVSGAEKERKLTVSWLFMFAVFWKFARIYIK